MTLDRVYGSVLTVFGIIYTLAALRLPRMNLPDVPETGLYPTLLGVVLIVLSLALVATGGSSPSPRSVFGLPRQAWRQIGGTVLACVAYAALMERVGFVTSTLLFTAGMLRLLERRSWLYTLAVAAGTAALCYVIFAVLLQAPLPRGWLF